MENYENYEDIELQAQNLKSKKIIKILYVFGIIVGLFSPILMAIWCHVYKSNNCLENILNPYCGIIIIYFVTVLLLNFLLIKK